MHVKGKNLRVVEWHRSYTNVSAQNGAWPLERGQNYVNLCKRRESQRDGMAQKLYECIGARLCMAIGEVAKLSKFR